MRTHRTAYLAGMQIKGTEMNQTYCRSFSLRMPIRIWNQPQASGSNARHIREREHRNQTTLASHEHRVGIKQNQTPLKSKLSQRAYAERAAE